MEIPGHKKRFVIIAALDVYGKALAAARKSNENAHCTTTDVDEKATILEVLKAEYSNVEGQLTLEGTGLGESLTEQHYKDDDGTDLRADALDDWMRRTAGAYVPYAVIAEWVLEKRKMVAAWLRGIDKNRDDSQKAKMDALVETAEGQAAIAAGDHPVLTLDESYACAEDAQRVGRTCAPDFIDVAWFTPPTPAPGVQMTDAEVDEWLRKGPWGCISYDGTGATPGSEWELVKRDGTDAANIIDRSSFVYPELERARHEAAVRNRNLAEADAPNEVASDSDVDASPSVTALHPE